MKKNRTKRILSILLTLCMVLTLVPMTAFSAETYTLTIVNGVKAGGGGETVVVGEAGSAFNITANEAPTGKVFDKWVSTDSGALTSPRNSTSWFTMPAEDVTVTATYKNEPQTDTELKGITVKVSKSGWETPELTPAFDREIRSYSLNLTAEYRSIYFYLPVQATGQTITATVDENALEVNTAASGFQTATHTLTKATTVFVFTITSKNKSKTGTYTVTVNRGSGITNDVTVTGGTTATPTPSDGDIVTITANEPAPGMVFDKWTTTDGVTFGNAKNATTTFVMPTKAVTVTATYKNEPETDTELKGITVKVSKSGWETPELTPAFDRETRSYSLNLTAEYRSIYFYLPVQATGQTITATVDENALEVNTAASGFQTATHTLTKATTVFVFTITSKNKSKTGTYTVTVNRGSGITNDVTVTGGTTATPTPSDGDIVTITANEPAPGMVFDKWTTTDGVTFGNAKNATTTFVMPTKAVTVTATYKNNPETDTELRNIKVYAYKSGWQSPELTPAFVKETRSYSLNLTADYNPIYFYLGKQVEEQTITATVDGNALTVNTALNGFETAQHTLTKATTVFVFTITAKDGSTNGTYTVTVNRESGTTHAVTVTGGTTATPTATAGDTVTITANEPATGKVFDKWTTTDGVTFGDVNSATTTFGMPAKAVTVTATYKDAPVTTYAVTVNSGTGGGNFAAGAIVSITANAPATGKVFDKWTTTDGVTFGDVNSATTTFGMPAKAVTVIATYKDAPVTTYAVTVNSGTGGGNFAAGAIVSITANAPATGKVFDKWTTTDGVTFGDVNSATTTFGMPAKAVTVTATYKDAPVTTYAVTVNSGTGGGNFAAGAIVSITANAPATGKVFDKWTTTDGVTFGDVNSATTTFGMPAKAVTVTATYKDAPVTTYAVTVNSGTGGGNFAAGAIVSITANAPATGKVFDKWTTTDGVTFGDVNSATTTFGMPAKAVTVTATYKDAPVTTYAVTVNSGTGGGNFAAGAIVSITANAPATGKVFDKWTTTDGVTFGDVNSATTTFGMLAKAVTVTATYKDAPVTTYAVTVNSGTGGGNFAEGATVNITANAPATGKVFDKWTTTDGVTFGDVNSATTTFGMLAKAVTVTATYKDAPVTTYAVTVNSGTGGGNFAEGATVNITANAPATGKVFDKWTTTDGVTFGDVNSATTTFGMPAKAVTVTATYKDAPVTTYAVTVNSGTGGGNFAAGAIVSITANAPATGKVFDKWTTTDGVTFGDVNSATTTFGMPAKAVTVTATYKDAPVTTYAVTVNSGTGGGNFAAGATVSITANAPATGKVFDKWTTTDGVTFGDVNSATTTFGMPAKAVTVTATYKDAPVTTYAVTVNSGTGGGNFAAGAIVSITANAPATGKVFDKWTTTDGVTFGDVNSATTTFGMPAKAVTVTATYKDAPVTTYAVTVNSGTGGGNFAAGAIVSITANAPATGKVFDKWTTSDGVTFGDANTATTTFGMLAKAVTVTATYKDISSETPDYKIIAGENGIWKKDNTKGIVIISNGDYDDFTGVNVDDIFIDPSNYTSAAGSTVVTLKPAYLETLAVGTHIVTLQFGNYSVQTNLTILAADERPDESKPDESKPDESKPDESKPDESKPDESKPDESKPDESKPDESKPDESKPNEESPKTGDSNHTLPLIGLLLLSGSALIGVTRNKKKKKSYNK